eukprot:g4859.t1
MKRQQRPGAAAEAASKRQKVDWRAAQQGDDAESELNDDELDNLELPPSSDEEMPEDNEALNKSDQRGREEQIGGSSSSNARSVGIAALPSSGANGTPNGTLLASENQSPSNDNPNSKAGSKASSPSAAPGAVGPDASAERGAQAAGKVDSFLIESFLRLSVQFGPAIRHDLVVETKVLCRLPKKLTVAAINPQFVTLVEEKDQARLEKERQRQQLAGVDIFAGLGGMEKLDGRNQSDSLYLPKKEEFPSVEKILGNPLLAESPSTAYLLTDAESRLFLTLAPALPLLRAAAEAKEDLFLLGRVLAPSTNPNIVEEEDPHSAFTCFRLLDGSPDFCPEPFSVDVTLDVARMQEKADEVKAAAGDGAHFTDQVAMVLSEFDSLMPDQEQAASSATGGRRRRKPKFIPAGASNTYSGSRAGFVFKLGQLGLGYFNFISNTSEDGMATAASASGGGTAGMQLDSMDSVDFYLQAREAETTFLKQQEYTQARHDRVAYLEKMLTQLKRDLTEVAESLKPTVARSGAANGPADQPTSFAFLVNPANEGLCGIQYPSFPRGGFAEIPFRTPAVTLNWCRAEGVDVHLGAPLEGIQGSDLTIENGGANTTKILQWGALPSETDGRPPPRFYSKNDCVDGMVHALCGDELERYFNENVPVIGMHGGRAEDETASTLSASSRSVTHHAVRCLPGDCVWTPAFGQLRSTFSTGGILHTVPPFDGFDYANVFRACRRTAELHADPDRYAEKLSSASLLKRNSGPPVEKEMDDEDDKNKPAFDLELHIVCNKGDDSLAKISSAIDEVLREDGIPDGAGSDRRGGDRINASSPMSGNQTYYKRDF